MHQNYKYDFSHHGKSSASKYRNKSWLTPTKHAREALIHRLRKKKIVDISPAIICAQVLYYQNVKPPRNTD